MTSSDLSSVALRRLGRRRSVGELREEYKSLFKEVEEDGEVSIMRTCIKCKETKKISERNNSVSSPGEESLELTIPHRPPCSMAKKGRRSDP